MIRRLSILFALTTLGGAASAHERWVSHELIGPYDAAALSPTSPFGLAVVVGCACLVGLLIGFDRRRGAVAAPAPWRHSPLLVRVGLGACLLLFALAGSFAAPDLHFDGSFLGKAMLGATAAAGALLLVGAGVRRVAWGVLALFGLAAAALPFLALPGETVSASHVFAYAYVAAAAVFLAFSGSGARIEARPSALALMRVVFGANVLMLGIAKFASPELFLGVVQNHPTILQQPFEGLQLTQERLTLLAAGIETSLGVLILLGTFARAVGLLVFCVFSLTTVLFRGEVLGHLPILAIAFVLTRDGAGSVQEIGAALRRLTEGTDVRRHPVSATARAKSVVFGVLLVASSLAVVEAAPPVRAGAHPSSLSADALDARRRGEEGRLEFTLGFDAGSPELHRFFSLTARVDGVDGLLPARGLRLEVDVTMPAHGHGMMTAPRTVPIGPGLFRVDGCKLHMHGMWVAKVVAYDGEEVVDRVSIPLDFEPEVR